MSIEVGVSGGTEMEMLLPCPFCGARAELERHREVAEIFRIVCSASDCGIRPRTEFMLEEYADELWTAWNSREASHRARAVVTPC
jgi:sarcosine oxidase delta subunit